MDEKVIFTWNESDNQEMRDKFDNVIQPMINNQTSNDKVFLVSDEYDTRWASPNTRLGKYVNTYELASPWFSGSEKDTKIVDSGNGLTLLKELNNGDVLSYDLYASPNESDELDLIRQCANFDNLKNNWWWGNEEDFEKFFNGEPIDGDVITDYFDSIVSAKGAIDYDKVEKYCNRIVNKLNESLNEERIQEGMKDVWSNNATLNSLLALSEEDLKAELVDYGYNEEFISDMSLDELHNILHEEETLWEMDIEDFENNIVPMINKQTCDGIVLMVGEAETWDGKHKGGKAVFTEDLKGGDIDPDVTDVEIVEEDGDLVWLGHHHDGTHKFRLYALPETDQVDFIRNCMEDAIEDTYTWYYSGEFDEVEETVLEDILSQFTDLNFLTEYINFSQVPNYCKPIKNLLNESLNEDMWNIYFPETTMARVTLDWMPDDIEFDSEEEVIQNVKETGLPDSVDVKVKTMKGGPWYESPEVTLEGPRDVLYKYLVDTDWDSTDAYDEIAGGWIDWHTLGNFKDESLNEASTKEPKKLAKELKEIKKLANDYGFEYFTAMPFTSYDNDPISIEYNYPEFFRIVKAFWKEMETLDDFTKEKYIEYADPKGEKHISKDDVNLNNPDVLDYLWDLEDQLAVENKSDFDHDFETIIKTCELILERGTPIQFEKIFKNNFDSGLNDDDILADRERQAALAAEYDESLNEEKKTADDLYEFANNLADVDSSETSWMFKSEDDLDSVLKLMHDNGVYPEYGYEVFKAYDNYYEGWISIDDFEDKVKKSLNESIDIRVGDKFYNHETKEMITIDDVTIDEYNPQHNSYSYTAHNIFSGDVNKSVIDRIDLFREIGRGHWVSHTRNESLKEEKKTYICDDCGYEVKLNDKEYTGQCPNCGEHHGFYEVDESLNEESNDLIDKIEDNLINEGFVKVQNVSSYKGTSFGGEDVYNREGNVIEFLTNSQMGYAYCNLNFDTNTFTYSDNWEGEDKVKEVFTDIKDLDHLISERSFYNYNIIPSNLEESLNEESKDDVIARNMAHRKNSNELEKMLMSFPSKGNREIDRKLTQWTFTDNSEEDYNKWIDQITNFVNDSRFKIYGGKFKDADTGEYVYQFILPWESNERQLKHKNFNLTDLTTILNKMQGVSLEEPLWDRYYNRVQEDYDYVVVKGVKVPKEYFDKHLGKTNFEIRDIFLADEEQDSPYMTADDIEEIND